MGGERGERIFVSTLDTNIIAGVVKNSYILPTYCPPDNDQSGLASLRNTAQRSWNVHRRLSHAGEVLLVFMESKFFGFYFWRLERPEEWKDEKRNKKDNDGQWNSHLDEVGDAVAARTHDQAVCRMSDWAEEAGRCRDRDDHGER